MMSDLEIIDLEFRLNSFRDKINHHRKDNIFSTNYNTTIFPKSKYRKTKEGYFKGLIIDGKRNGFGCLFNTVSQTIYFGSFVNDQKNGNGELMNSDGSTIFKGNKFES